MNIDLAREPLVNMGEAVGVLAAQSIRAWNSINYAYISYRWCGTTKKVKSVESAIDGILKLSKGKYN